MAIQIDVAALASGLPTQDGGACQVGQQRFIRLSRTRPLEYLGKQAGGERELVALAGQGERLKVTERQKAVQVIAAVERAQLLNGPAALVTCGSSLVGDLRG